MSILGLAVYAAPVTEWPPQGFNRISQGSPRHFDILEWLLDEAAMLDARRYDAWLSILRPEIEYRMPTRATVHKADGSGFYGPVGHFDEDYTSLTLRVRRLVDSKTAWSEDPPSRTRRFVTNVRTAESADPDQLATTSNILMVRNQGNAPDLDLLSAERHDLFQREENAWKLRSRLILVDQSTLGTMNMALFL